MYKFLSIDRTFGPKYPRAIALVERLALFNRINALAEACGHGTMHEYLEGMGEAGGIYSTDPVRHIPDCETPSVLYANHPLGFADGIAAMRLMLADGQSFRMMAARVVDIPPAAQPYGITVDASGRDKAFNGRAMARILREFGRDYSRLFVFPSGLTSHLELPSLTPTDQPWSDAYWRIAQRASANLIPLWFSGRASWSSYLLFLLLGRSGRVALPHEFFRRRKDPLIVRIGAPIPAASTVFFGDQRAAALRAASYGLETNPGPDPALWAPDAPADPQPVTSCEIAVHTPEDVNRNSILALRRACLGEDAWTDADGLARHVTFYADSRCVAACRLLDWGSIDQVTLDRVSAVHSVFVPDATTLRDHRIVEFGELCVQPGFDDPILLDQFASALRTAIFASGEVTAAIGVVSLAAQNPVLAAAQFEFARRNAPSPLASHFKPKQELITPSRHHDFHPSRIRYDEQPSPNALPSALRNHLALGARLGQSANWAQRGSRASILATMTR
ncbi:MAG: hypothetical protein EOP22_01230 [Hyphomicrobiales bacterium]|nr:MAG: hypothetical protein EOP22_01230 [Hyphomicrobiales bacterium]